MSSSLRKYLPWLIFLFLVLLQRRGGVTLTAAAGKGKGKVPAIIVFGDSSVDTGNNNFIPTIARSNFYPYGRDFGAAGGHPTGRFSNGRLATDFISEAFGLPSTIPAYLDTALTIDDLARGVSFASASTGLDNATAGIMSVITVAEQVGYFKEYKERLRLSSRLGEPRAEEIVAEALYIWSVGTNDFIENYYNLPQRRMQYPTAAEYGAYLLGLAEAAVREVHALGGRKMDFTGLTPMGCLPAERMGNRGQCNEEYNAVARSFNAKLRGTLVPKLNRELAGLRLVYADTYELFDAVVSKPGDYGFENAERGCCGTGMFEAGYFCGTSFLCRNANKYVFFDAIHPTERMYNILANTVMNTTLHVFL